MSDNKVNIEDLLKLKRAEQPTDAQWAQFDRQMKAKLIRQVVCKPSTSQRIISFLSPIKLALTGSISAAVAGIVLFISGNMSEVASYEPEMGQFRVSSTPLPKVEPSFTQNEIAKPMTLESPVFAQITQSDNNIQFVANHMPQASGGSF